LAFAGHDFGSSLTQVEHHQLDLRRDQFVPGAAKSAVGPEADILRKFPASIQLSANYKGWDLARVADGFQRPNCPFLKRINITGRLRHACSCFLDLSSSSEAYSEARQAVR
jgi:hypothetical protein